MNPRAALFKYENAPPDKNQISVPRANTFRFNIQIKHLRPDPLMFANFHDVAKKIRRITRAPEGQTLLTERKPTAWSLCGGRLS